MHLAGRKTISMNQITVTGMIISTSPIKEYDRRVVILTKELGKITAFANGSRKPNSPLVGVVNPFSFGEFVLYDGRTSYTVKSVKINNYFEGLRNNLNSAYCGFYFLEIADYFAREHNDEKDMLRLLYMTLKALENEKISNELVRCIFELKVLSINGIGPEVFGCLTCGGKENSMLFNVKRGGLVCKDCMKKENTAKSRGANGKETENECNSILLNISTLYTMQFIMSSKLDKLYTFQVSDGVLSELKVLMNRIYEAYVEREFKSLEMLDVIVK